MYRTKVTYEAMDHAVKQMRDVLTPCKIQRARWQGSKGKNKYKRGFAPRPKNLASERRKREWVHQSKHKLEARLEEEEQ